MALLATRASKNPADWSDRELLRCVLRNESRAWCELSPVLQNVRSSTIRALRPRTVGPVRGRSERARSIAYG